LPGSELIPLHAVAMLANGPGGYDFAPGQVYAMPELCFGGSFNPIHNGHLLCAQAVARTKGYDQVVLIPSAQPPHKPPSAQIAGAVDRLTMCRLAVADNPLFSVCDIETRRGGLSYTIDTVHQLRASGFGEIHWLIGADMLIYLPKWHKPLELLREVDFIIMARPGWTVEWESLPAEFRFLKEHVVEAPRIDISASEIRARIGRGLSIEGLTPDPVIRYIERHGLYANPGDPRDPAALRPEA
jgi:nicotinate-nucleotide adenylyltransferase